MPRTPSQNRKATSSLRTRSRRRRLAIEMLEDRRLLATVYRIEQNFEGGGAPYSVIEPVTPGVNGVTSGGPTGNFFRLNGTTSNSTKNGQPDLLLFDDTLRLAGNPLTARFDYRETPYVAGGAEGLRFTLYPASMINSTNSAYLTHQSPFPIDIGAGFPGVLHLHFDTFNNAQGHPDPNIVAREPNNNHLEVNYNSNASASGWLTSTNVPFDINDGNWRRIEISLVPDGSDGLLTVKGTAGSTTHTIIAGLRVPGFAFTGDYRVGLWCDYGAAISLHDIDEILIQTNAPPTLDPISNLTINEDAPLQTVNLTGVTAGAGETQPLQITAVSGNTSLISNVQVLATGGGFASVQQYTAQNTTHGVTTGDFDGDGNLDIAVCNTFSNSATIAFGNGNGGFSAPISIDVGSQPYDITSGDFNGDGFADIVVSNFENNLITIRRGAANRTFSAAQSFASGNGTAFPQSTGVWVMQAADVNNDGKLDVLAGNQRHDFVSVMLGNGTGGFGAPIKTQTLGAANGSGSLFGLTVADFNKDGRQDIAVNIKTEDAVKVLFGNNDGTFTLSGAYTVGDNPFEITAGDFDADGSVDLAAVMRSPTTAIYPLWNNGSGAFSVGTAITVGGDWGWSITSGDVDGDGDHDIAFGGPGDGGVIRYLASNGNRTFGSLQTFTLDPTGRLSAEDLRFADFNRDGILDIVTSSNKYNETGSIGVLLGTPSSYRLSFSPLPNQNGQSVITVTVEDGGNDRNLATKNDNATFSRSFTVTVNPVNDSPTDISLSSSSIPENAGANATVGTLSTTDVDVGDTYTYTLVTGTGDTDNAAFNINGSTLRANNSFNFETKSSYTVRVRSTDQGGLFTEKAFTITVTNVNEAPTDIGLSSSSIAENAGANAVVGALSTTDVDAGNTFTYSLVTGAGDADNGSFNISGNSLQANNSFDFETKSSYTVRVRSTDQGALFTEKSFAITVTDVSEAVYDFGDAPSPYPVTLARNGARHEPVGPTLGSARDAEPDGIPSANADSDGNDEDGIVFGVVRPGQLGAIIIVTVQNAPSGAFLDGWIDFNTDGNWGGSDERVFAKQAVSQGDNTLRFDVPIWTPNRSLVARFRLSSTGVNAPTGLSADGEVQDMLVPVTPPVSSTLRFSSPTQLISPGKTLTRSLDVDGDGDMDFFGDNYWAERNSTGTYTLRTLTNRVINGVDIDFDGDIDFVGMSTDQRDVVILRNNGSQSFVSQSLGVSLATATYTNDGGEGRVSDIDGDGDFDILMSVRLDAGGSNHIRIIEQTATGWTSRLISSNGERLYDLHAADLDRDGDLDIAYSTYDSPGMGRVGWYRNNGGWSFTELNWTTTWGQAVQAFPVDYDSDGDMDVLAVGPSDLEDEIELFSNNGNGTFTQIIPQSEITPHTYGVSSATAADITGDGRFDIVWSDWWGQTLGWMPHRTASPFPVNKLHTFSAQGTFNWADDLNDDGAIDILLANHHAASDTGIVYAISNIGNVTLDRINDRLMSSESIDIPLSGIRSNRSSQTPLRVTATSSRNDLLSISNINYLSPNTTGTLTLARNASSISAAVLINVMVEDGGPDANLATVSDNATFSRDFVVIVKANESPTDISLSSNSIAENAGTNETVGTLSTTDVDVGNTFTYTLVTGTGDTDNAAFNISGSTLRATNSFDFETNSNFTIRVRSTDQDGLFFEKAFSLTVTNVNEAPTNINLSSMSIAENAGSDFSVGTLSTNDVDAGNTFAYSLVAGVGSADNAAFTILGATLRATNSFDFESKSSYAIRIRSTDQGGLFAEKSFTISVTDVNESPTDISLSSNTIDENSAANTPVGTLSTTDPDGGNTFTYSLVTGTGDTDNASFNINGNTLRATNSFDFETKSSYTVRVRSTDQGGLFIEKTFTITVTNVNEAPTDISLSSSSIAENAGANAVVGTLSTTDVDAGNTFTYSLVTGAGDADNGSFNISGNSLRATDSFNFEAKSSYTIRVRSTDQGGLFTEKTFAITITNVNETPTDIALSSSSIAENAGANAVVGALSTTDPDAGNTFTYALVAGAGDADNGAFNISGSTLRASNSFDFETNSSYTVRIRSTDQDGLFFEKVFTISVTDVNESPVLTSSQINVTGNVLTTFTNSGTWSDPEGDSVALSASLGMVTKNGDGTWGWSFVPSQVYTNQTITITGNDGNSTSQVTFTINSLVAVVNSKVYYKGSSFANTSVNAALDTSKVIAKSGATAQALTFANLINTTFGINGLVFDIADPDASSLTTLQFVFRMSPTGNFVESTNPPSSWAAAPAPTLINVIAGTSTTPTRVRFEWTDNAIANRWLQIKVSANASPGLLSPQVFYVGHLQGETNGLVEGGAFRIRGTDVSPIVAAINPGLAVPISNIFDLNKDGRVRGSDASPAVGAVNALLLTRITIPPAGSANEGEGDTGRSMIAVPGVEPPKVVFDGEDRRMDTTIRARLTDMIFDVPLPTIPEDDGASASSGPAASVSTDSPSQGTSDLSLLSLDEYFERLGKDRSTAMRVRRS